jgi:hypothetical protein
VKFNRAADLAHGIEVIFQNFQESPFAAAFFQTITDLGLFAFKNNILLIAVHELMRIEILDFAVVDFVIVDAREQGVARATRGILGCGRDAETC